MIIYYRTILGTHIYAIIGNQYERLMKLNTLKVPLDEVTSSD